MGFILYPTLQAIRHARDPKNEQLIPLLGALFVLLIGSMTDDVFGGLLHTGFYLVIATVVSIDATLSLASQPETSPSPLRTVSPTGRRYEAMTRAPANEG